VIIKLMPSTIVMGDANNSYIIRNLRAYCDVLDVADGSYYKMVNSVLDQGVLSLPFKKFYSFYFPRLDSSGALRASIASQSLDAAYLVFLTPTSDAAYRTAPTTANSVAPAFKRNVGTLAAGLQNVQWDVSSCLYPQFSVTPTDAYYLLQNTMGLIPDRSSWFFGGVDTCKLGHRLLRVQLSLELRPRAERPSEWAWIREV
jgi:hypothetical protein